MITQTHRPVTFKQVAGQKLNKQTLKAVAKEPETAPKVIILQGSFGSAKTTSARIFARLLNCANPVSNDPCMKCKNCLMDINKAYYYTEYDSAVIGNVEEIKKLRDTFTLTLSQGYRVIVFDEIHMASKQAQTSLLKVIEEVKGNIFFMFATTHIQDVLPTIRSRAMELRFSTITADEVVENLRGVASSLNVEIEDKILYTIATRSKGHMRNAHMLLDKYILLGDTLFKESVLSSKDSFIKFFGYSLSRSHSKTLEAIYEIQTFPLADLKSDYEELILDLLKEHSGVDTNNENVKKLHKLTGSKTLQLAKTLLAQWVIDGFRSDVRLQATLFLLNQLISGTKPQPSGETKGTKILSRNGA